jgi:endonuclease/exonuclease/phosphatase family metal-dependent hydrolase
MPTITVATYNVHEWVGVDGRRDPDRVIRVLRELRADVIALQEVSLPLKHSMPFALPYISETTGMYAVPGPILVKKNNDYGNLLLSKHPLERIEKIDLSVDAREPRGAIVGFISTDGVSLKIIGTHLGLRKKERKRQWRRLIDKIDLHSHEIVVLMGDLNEWNPFGRNARWLRSFFGKIPAPCTYPARYPVLSLDRILIYPKSVRAEICVHRSKLACVASDHLPVVARIWVVRGH